MSSDFIQVPAWESARKIRHGFGTATGPASGEPPYRELARQLGIADGNIITAEQVHGTSVMIAPEVAQGGQADILITNQPGQVLGIRTADCVPVLLWDEASPALSAVHAGWRGTAARIVEIAVKALEETYGTKPARINAAVGPSIGFCCYEVGPEVVKAMKNAYEPPFPIRPSIGKHFHIDLKEFNRQALLRAGVPVEKIHVLSYCTNCQGEKFHSYRRDGEAAGRQLSFIGAL